MIASRRVSESLLRQAFNNTGYFERAQTGDILVTVIRDNEPDERYRQPPGTRSQTLRYDVVRNRQLVKVAIVHQFVLADGSIHNAAGRPDPKWVLIQDEVWVLERAESRTGDN